MSADEQGQPFHPPGRGGKAKADHTPGNRSRASSGRRNGSSGGKSPTPPTENDRSSAPSLPSAMGKQEHRHNNEWSRPSLTTGPSEPNRVSASPAQVGEPKHPFVATRSRKADNFDDRSTIPSDLSKLGADSLADVTFEPGLTPDQCNMIETARANLRKVKRNVKNYLSEIQTGKGNLTLLRDAIEDDLEKITKADEVSRITGTDTIGIVASNRRDDCNKILSQIGTMERQTDNSSIETQEEMKPAFVPESSKFIIDTTNVETKDSCTDPVDTTASSPPPFMDEKSPSFRSHPIDSTIGYVEHISPFNIRVGQRVTSIIGPAKTIRFGFIIDSFQNDKTKRIIQVLINDSKEEVKDLDIDQVFLPSATHKKTFWTSPRGVSLGAMAENRFLQQTRPLQIHWILARENCGEDEYPTEALKRLNEEWSWMPTNRLLAFLSAKNDRRKSFGTPSGGTRAPAGDTHAKSDPNFVDTSTCAAAEATETAKNITPSPSNRDRRGHHQDTSYYHTGTGFGDAGEEAYLRSLQGQPPSVIHDQPVDDMRLSGRDRLKGAAHGGYNPALQSGFLDQLVGKEIKYPSVLTLLSKIPPMLSDSAVQTKNLYEGVAFILSAGLGVPKILPSFKNTANLDLKSTLLPPPNPTDRYNVALSQYYWLAQALGKTLLTKISKVRAPNAATAISSPVCRSIQGDDGFMMIQQILQTNVIRNGAMIDDDFEYQINNYKAQPGTPRTAVEEGLNAILLEAEAHGCSVQHHCILKNFLRILRSDPSIGPYVAQTSTKLDKHLRSAVKDQQLLDGDGNEVTPRSINHMLDRLGIGSMINEASIMNVPTIASAASTIGQDQFEWGEDDKVQFSTKLGEQIGAELQHLAETNEDLFHDTFSVISDLLDVDTIPSIHALKTKYCDCCNRKGHDADGCFIRGTAFLPPTMKKKVLQYNLINGDEPKEPPKDRPRQIPGDATPPKSASKPSRSSFKPSIKSMDAQAGELTKLYPELPGMIFDLDNYVNDVISAPLTGQAGNESSSTNETPLISAPLLAGSAFTEELLEETDPSPTPAIKSMAAPAINAADAQQQSTVEISEHNTFSFENLQVNC